MSEAGVMAGGRVVGRYVLYDELAAGGMATVHIGRLVGEVGFSRSVAIKRLHAQFAHDPEFVAMFLEEARLAARIRHPNVVPVLDVVSLESELFLVMEYIQGETLTRLTRVARNRNRIVPMPIALAIAADMLAGLHAAHEAKDEAGQPLRIVHRDISPHNVMVGHDGIARVLDFGIAKASSSAQSTRDGEVRGKFAYMSPEQLSSVPVDRRADVFATSIVLWEMLTGQRLFQASDPAGIVGKVLHGAILPPGAVAGGLPPSVDALVMKGLERDPNRRFSSAQEMARELENLRVAIARPTEVGVWVDRIAGDTMKKRARRIAEIESTGSYSASQPLAAVAALHGSYPPDHTPSRSQSGLRPREPPPPPQPPPQAFAPVMPAVHATHAAPFDAPHEEELRPKRHSRVGIVFVAFLACALGAGAFFAWKSGGVGPAREKLMRLLPQRVATTAQAAVTAPSASASGAAASSAGGSVPDGLLIDTTTGTPAQPNLRYRSRSGGAGARAGASGATGANGGGQGSLDPRLTTNLPTGPAGQGGGDLGDAMKSASGGGAGVGKDAIQQQVGPQNMGARPSQGQVQVAIAAVMPNVRACLLPDDPASRAMMTFQSDGTVKNVSVTGFAAGKPQEACIKSALQRAKVDPFSDATFGVPVNVRP